MVREFMEGDKAVSTDLSLHPRLLYTKIFMERFKEIFKGKVMKIIMEGDKAVSTDLPLHPRLSDTKIYMELFMEIFKEKLWK